MSASDVYLGLGGNIGDTPSVLRSALRHIAALSGLSDFKVSRFYQTTPVSDAPQAPYVNAVCCFKTTLGAYALLAQLQKIEALHGKLPKPKNAPRPIDIDILFFGLEQYAGPELEIPHPRWRERLFVIKPLSDLKTTITVPDKHNANGLESVELVEFMRIFPNIHHEIISLLPEGYEGEP